MVSSRAKEAQEYASGPEKHEHSHRTHPTRAAGKTQIEPSQYELVVGMEVHAQALTRSKMFCRCATDYQGAPPNTRVCPVCLGMPGALPVINRAAVEATIKTGLALNCTIAETAVFARKNYTYPDLPKGYQISQYELPLCQNGWLEIDLEDGATKTACAFAASTWKRTRAARSTRAATRYIDLNRAGVPLMEIVTEADIHSAGGGLCLPDQAARHPARAGREQRRHGEGRAALRAEHQRAHAGAEGARRVWHQGRGQEPQQLPLRAQRHRLRAGAPDRRARRRRRGRAGQHGLGRGAPAHGRAAQQGGRPRLSLLPRARPAAAAGEPRRGGAHRAPRCPNCPAPSATATCSEWGVRRIEANTLSRREPGVRASTRRRWPPTATGKASRSGWPPG